MTTRALASAAHAVPLICLVLVIHTFATAALAQDERWHEQTIPALPAGPIIDDMAFHVDEGYLAVRGGDGLGYVVRMDFPPGGVPSFTDMSMPSASYTLPFLVSYSGGDVLVTTEIDAISIFDVGAGSWSNLTVPVSVGISVYIAETNASGGAAFLLAAESLLGSGPNVHRYDAGTWTGHQAGIDGLHLAVLDGSTAAAVTDSGVFWTSQHSTLQEGDPWQDTAFTVPLVTNGPSDASAAWLGGGALAAVSAGDGGSFALLLEGLDTGIVVVSDCSGAAPLLGFRRVASAGGALYALDRSGRVHRIADPSSCSAWETATMSPAIFQDGVGLGAVSGDLAVAVGLRAANEPIVAWRNRPPALAAIASLLLDDGTSTTLTLAPSDPDPADAALLSVSVTCPPELLAVTISGNEATLSAVEQPELCPSDVALVATCEATASDGELTSAPVSFVVTIEGVDDDAPVTQALVLEPGSAITGDPVTVSVQATDCVSPLTVTWEVRAVDDSSVLAHTSVDTTAPYEAAFPAPDAFEDNSARSYTVTAIVSDGALQTEESAILTVIGAIPVASLGVCPATVTAGDSADFTLVLDDVVPLAGWDLELSLLEQGSDGGAGLDILVEQPASAPLASVTPSRCHPADAFVGHWRAKTEFNDLPYELTCPNETAIVPLPSPPSLEHIDGDDGDKVVTVALGSEGVDVSLLVNVLDDCVHDNTVTWDLASLPSVLWPSGSELVVQTSSAPTRELTLSADREDAAQLIGVEATVTAQVAPEGDEEPAEPVTFVLRFVVGQDFLSDAVVQLDMSVSSLRALDLGDVIRVHAELSSTLPFALDALTVELANGDLAVLDDTMELEASPCGATGRVLGAAERLQLETSGVSKDCSLSFHFLARKGLARESLRVERCTWGENARELQGCGGEVVVERPRALGCAQASGSSPALLALLFALALARRRQ